MALGCLGELEEMFPEAGRPSCSKLYQQAVDSARTFYNDHHVYPYTYQGSYYYRQGMYKEAFSSWANAGNVIRLLVLIIANVYIRYFFNCVLYKV